MFMVAVYPAKYYDDWGEEVTTIENDGKHLSTLIRSIRFEGTDFDALEPATDSPNPASFTLAAGMLCNCVFEFEIPVPLTVANENILATLFVHLKLGKPRADGGIDEELLQLTLRWHNYAVSSLGKSGWFADELSDLQSAMPQGSFIRCCFNCAFSHYHPAGFGLFGGLACFRDNKQVIVSVRSKSDLFKIWNSMTEFVQEIYLCPEFHTRL
jgi:hypothetical protein